MDNEKLKAAMSLLERIEDHGISALDGDWYRDYYLLTGNHMIRTTAGWLSGESLEDYEDEGGKFCGILEEINVPNDCTDSMSSVQPSSSTMSTTLHLVPYR